VSKLTVRLRRATPILVALAACSPSRRPVAPQPAASTRLAVAETELRAGCLDCLESAYRQYDAMRQSADTREVATAGAVRAATLIAIRHRELGMMDEGYLATARTLAAGAAALPPWLPTLIDIADALPASRGGIARPPASDVDLERMRIVRQNRDAWGDLLRGAARSDVGAAYTWLALACDSTDTRSTSTTEIFEAASTFAGAPLVVYREALCRTVEAKTLESLLAADGRFVEVTFALGLQALAARPPQLDAADRWLRQAYDWRPKWPALTLAMAGVAMTGEEFDRAHRLYGETLALEPHSADALLGDVRALTYLGARDEAIATADRLIAERWSVGDARYWRAYNELQLARLDEAWSDVEQAEKTLVNAEVPKLAGIIAYRRQQLDTSIARFATSQARNPFDCETRFYLGVVHAELRHWPDTAATLTSAAACLEAAEEGLQQEIARIAASTLPADRQARQIARRQQQIADGRRMRATSWFDSAVAYFSLSNHDEARACAEKVVDDEQFGARAKELLARLR